MNRHQTSSSSMNRHQTCDIINLEEIKSYRGMLDLDDHVLRNHLQSIYVNYSGDWDTMLDQTRDTLREKIMRISPGSELLSCRVYHALWLYVPPIILALGTIGNLLSFSVLCGRSMVQVSSYIYLATLSLVDEGVLLTGLLRKWIDILLGRKLDNINSEACKLIQVAGTWTSCLSVWLIVALTVERFIVSAFPLRANRYATTTRAKVVIAGIVTTFFIFSLHFFETVDLVRLPESEQPPQSSTGNYSAGNIAFQCDFKPKYARFGQAWMWFDATLYSYLPFFVITVLNIVIVRGIYIAGRMRARMSYVTQKRILVASTDDGAHHHRPIRVSKSTSSEATRQLTIMLLVVSFVFLLTTTPIVVIKFLLFSVDFKGSVRRLATIQLVDAIADMLMYCNHALNFCLYCAMGNKFRQQLWSLCCPVKRQRLESGIDTNGVDKRRRRTETLELMSVI